MFIRKPSSKMFTALLLAAGATFAAESAVAAEFPVGTYTTSGITLAFDDKGQFHVSQGSEMKVEGTYTTDAGQVRFSDERGPWACTQAEKSGSYQWKADKETLAFSKTDDACKNRVDSLTAHPWKKK